MLFFGRRVHDVPDARNDAGTKNNGWRQIVGQPADAVNP